MTQIDQIIKLNKKEIKVNLKEKAARHLKAIPKTLKNNFFKLWCNSLSRKIAVTTTSPLTLNK